MPASHQTLSIFCNYQTIASNGPQTRELFITKPLFNNRGKNTQFSVSHHSNLFRERESHYTHYQNPDGHKILITDTENVSSEQSELPHNDTYRTLQFGVIFISLTKLQEDGRVLLKHLDIT